MVKNCYPDRISLQKKNDISDIFQDKIDITNKKYIKQGYDQYLYCLSKYFFKFLKPNISVINCPIFRPISVLNSA